jgi:hypothetical protein
MGSKKAFAHFFGCARIEGPHTVSMPEDKCCFGTAEAFYAAFRRTAGQWTTNSRRDSSQATKDDRVTTL